ncbi:hypothetical protein LOC67_21260 [Stieleria sp. JC731]|uniref:hypothetical protein n=1 Tax=Pirellulaceae TaxID=2691357 RepID=UPI001E520258|nr:hypothetical protein [Stieleria sp. JC731]MCC9603086.1 hypothetical protein [Stieleria sp. JC731]
MKTYHRTLVIFTYLFAVMLVPISLFSETSQVIAGDVTAGHVAAGERILEDHFDRQEKDDTKEDVGHGWSTNSKSRAKGNKQADLADGALHIYRHEVADHGVSVVHDLDFKNVTIGMKFKISSGDELGINFADMNEKSVHAGHLCVAKIRPTKLTIIDLKTGRMKLDVHERSKAKTLTPADRKLIKSKEQSFAIDLSKDAWHDLQVQIENETMIVSIDGKKIGSLTSSGIGHDTKSRLRLAVLKNAWVDDVIVERN